MASLKRRKTASGYRYDVRWHADGGQRSKSFKVRSQAEQWKRQVEHDESIGLISDARSGVEPLGRYAERWLATRLVQGTPVADMTRVAYAGLLRRNIVPTLGKVQLRRLTTEVIREWHSDLTNRLGQDAAAKSYRLLRAILTTAADDDMIGKNPCRIRGGGSEHADERPLIPTSTVLDLANAIEDRYRALIFLAGFGALRTGESLGLRRKDIDPLRRAVKIEQQAQEVAGMGRVVSSPKSEAGRREVVLPRMAMDALVVHMDTYTGVGPDSVVFTAPRGGPVRRDRLSKAWAKAKAMVGTDPGLRLHDLRHGAATMTARSGATTKELMTRIGHSSPRAALRYQHATAERDRKVADYLDDEIASAADETRPNVVPLAGVRAISVR